MTLQSKYRWWQVNGAKTVWFVIGALPLLLLAFRLDGFEWWLLPPVMVSIAILWIRNW